VFDPSRRPLSLSVVAEMYAANIVADSSWMAAAYLRTMRADEVLVFHQVRHPLRVIGSLLNIGFWSDDNLQPWGPRFAEAVLWREMGRLPSRHLRGREAAIWSGIGYWIGWNEMVRRACQHRHGCTVLCYRVEDLDYRADPGRAAALLAAIAGKNASDCRPALESVPPQNCCLDRDAEEVQWRDVPICWRDRLLCAARSYGYSDEEVTGVSQ
jgi:hypothetical protein